MLKPDLLKPDLKEDAVTYPKNYPKNYDWWPSVLGTTAGIVTLLALMWRGTLPSLLPGLIAFLVMLTTATAVYHLRKKQEKSDER